jgi:SAM-dependent methyltransferase
MMRLLVSLMRRLHAPIYRFRLRELVKRITPLLRGGERVLDVGCGFGALGRAIMEHPACPAGVEVRGLERVARDQRLVRVDEYDGRTIPYGDESFDVVILADVLHHEADPHRLLEECRRVARRLLIIKDHVRSGPFAQARLALLDWAANAPYGVPCRFQYNRLEEWRRWHAAHGFTLLEEHTSMRLYPPVVNAIFGGRLQYFAVVDAQKA